MHPVKFLSRGRGGGLWWPAEEEEEEGEEVFIQP